MFAKKNKPTIYKLTKLYLAQKLINILDLFFIIFLYVYILNYFFYKISFKNRWHSLRCPV